jgi:hypothetical protein
MAQPLASKPAKFRGVLSLFRLVQHQPCSFPHASQILGPLWLSSIPPICFVLTHPVIHILLPERPHNLFRPDLPWEKPFVLIPVNRRAQHGFVMAHFLECIQDWPASSYPDVQVHQCQPGSSCWGVYGATVLGVENTEVVHVFQS